MWMTTNITNSPDDVERYRDKTDVCAFLDKFGLDGVELMPMGGDENLYCIPEDRVIGVHLPIQADWFDFWAGNEQALLNEYGSLDTVSMMYGGTDPRVIVETLKRNLDFAARLHAKYVVFHVSNVNLTECATYRFTHTDEEVCRAAAEIINAAMEGKTYPFEFLMENLWWPGFTMTRLEITREMLEAVRFSGKGIMLDTGHLMHTDLDLGSQSEALEYIHRQLDAHGALCGYIRGVHLHQSITGAHVKQMLKEGVARTGDYWTDFGNVYRHILQIDCHQPLSVSETKRLIERIEPEYLTHEFITSSRIEHEIALEMQTKVI